MAGAIGIFIPEFPSQTHVFFWREVTALRAMGRTVRLFSTARPPASECKHRFRDEATAETDYVFPPGAAAIGAMLRHPLGLLKALGYVLGIEGIGLKERVKALAFLVCAAELAARARRHSVTHVHGHSCANSAHIVAMAGYFGGPTYSLTLHGALRVYGAGHRRKMREARFVHTAGKHLVASVVHEAGVPEAKVSGTLMGIDTDAFQDEGRRKFVDGKLHLVTVARLHEGKGHHFALEAMKRAVDAGCDVTYTIAGSGPNLAGIEADVRRLGLDGRVKLAGQLAEEEVLELLQTADLFVLASVGDFEAMPVSVMEAMACGLPAAASVIGGTPDMITHGVDGYLVAQRDVEALATVFVGAARDGGKRRAMAEAARARAVRQFDLKVTAAKLLADIDGTRPR